MTYSFIDTTAHGSANNLPTEALAIEGNYIENIIDNLNLDAEYRTLTVSGRELLAPELKTAEVGMRDGVFYNGKHMPSREIKIKYRLIALTSQAFREAYNKLSGILLSIEQSQLVFADEPDKFFLGTFSGTDDVEEGRNAVNGEFTITCTDPCKYSIEEYMPELQNGVFTIDYDGTFVAHPIFEVVFQGDCGRVSFANDKGKALQFGDDEVTDTFTSGDELVIDTNDGSVVLNGTYQSSLGAIGNQWEAFNLVPGVNQIGASCSQGAVAPTFSMKYRKVFI